MMQKPSPIFITDRFPELLNALLDLLRGFSPAEWEHPTAAAGWTVKDVALHLLGDEVSNLSRRRDGFIESPVNITGWAELVAWLNERNNVWVQATRQISPRLLCDLLQFTGNQMNDYFRSLDLTALGGAVSWAGPNPTPVWLDVAREFTERWHHQQHVRDAVGKPGLTEPRYLAPVLAAFVHALPYTYRQVDAVEGTCVTLTIMGDSGGSWSVLREGDRWQLYAGKPDQPNAETVLPEEIAWRVFTKGIAKETAFARARFYGDPTLGARMLDAVSIIA
jgi:uncharacterized protein (TIGR03083 family)